jgi:hypothetical protein
MRRIRSTERVGSAFEFEMELLQSRWPSSVPEAKSYVDIAL